MSVEPGTGAVALRNVPNTLSIFDSHFPRFHVLPGVLILGSLGALGALAARRGNRAALAARREPTRSAFATSLRPAIRCSSAVKLKERTAEGAIGSGEVEVEGSVVTRARRLRFAPIGA